MSKNNTEPDNVLSIVQSRRLDLLDTLKSGVVINKDELMLLTGLATTAVATKRIATEDKNAKLDRAHGAKLAKVFSTYHQNPFHKDNGSVVIEHAATLAILPEYNVVEGETSTTLEFIELHEVMQ